MDEQRHGFLERLFNEQSKGLRKFFRNHIRKSADIPDLVQEVYLRILKVKDPEAIRRPVSYLYSVASNLLKEYRKRERRSVNLSDFDEKTANKLLGELPSLDGELEEIQILNRLYSVIARMPDKKIRTAMTLKYRHGLTYFEIAEAMHISSSSVKTFLAMGIAICLAEVS
jgi:RNA polymerase sigma factor (sigma-70 family)